MTNQSLRGVTTIGTLSLFKSIGWEHKADKQNSRMIFRREAHWCSFVVIIIFVIPFCISLDLTRIQASFSVPTAPVVILSSRPNKCRNLLTETWNTECYHRKDSEWWFILSVSEWNSWCSVGQRNGLASHRKTVFNYFSCCRVGAKTDFCASDVMAVTPKRPLVLCLKLNDRFCKLHHHFLSICFRVQVYRVLNLRSLFVLK